MFKKNQRRQIFWNGGSNINRQMDNIVHEEIETA